MKTLILFNAFFFIFSSNIYSQTRREIITSAYQSTFGILPSAGELARLEKDKKISAENYSETMRYFNRLIFVHRESMQREIIKRAYVSVLQRNPTSQEVESYYNTTTQKSKNFTELSKQIRSYFKSEIDYPE